MKKKVLSLLLAVVMTFSLAVTANADISVRPFNCADSSCMKFYH